MTSEGLGEMFEGDSADMCAGKFPLVSKGGRAEGLACADPGARTPISASGNFIYLYQQTGQSLIHITFLDININQVNMTNSNTIVTNNQNQPN